MERVITFLLFYCIGLLCLAQAPDAELISQETSISLKNEKLIKSINYEIQINNRDGEKYATVSIPFSRLIKVSKIEASIKDTNGIIIKKLPKSELKERSAISDYSLFEDNYVKEFTLKHNVYPYRICYSYEEQQEEYISIENWLPVLDFKIPTRKAVLKTELPLGYKVSYRSQFTDRFRSDTTALTVILTWVVSYNDLIEPETSSPGLVNFMPRVIIVPDEFKYDMAGSLESWSKYGEWETNLQKGLSDLPQSEKYIVQDLISGVTDTKEKVKKLYHYLQDHTRYINITIETGGLKPYPASYVAGNKYGDCKALTNYFKSVLEVAGIRSFCTDVNAGDKIAKIYKSFPSQQFNHVILCVPVNNDSIWLDCTSKMAFGYLGTFTSARDVFLVDEGRSHLTRTPELSYNDVKESRNVFIHQDSQNQAVANFRNSYRGEKYEYYFDLSSSVNDADRLQIFTNNIVRNGFELIDFSIPAPPRDSEEILLTYSAHSGKIYKAYGKDLLIDVLPFSVPQFEDPKKRKLPVQLDFPVYKTDSLVYEIPPDYNSPDKLTNQSVTSEFGIYGIKSVVTGNKVSVIKSFLLFPGKYSLEKYSDFYKFITKVNQIENNDIIVTSKKF
jgi:transglutaminase-like putative cysteine protease